MFGISFPELVIIFLVAFLVAGPKRMNKFAKDLGVWMRRARTEWTHFQQTKMPDWDPNAFYETKTELNKALDEIKKIKPINDDNHD